MTARRIAAAIVGAEIVLAASFGFAGVTHHMSGTVYAQGDSAVVEEVAR